jgi:hypothetical protein
MLPKQLQETLLKKALSSNLKANQIGKTHHPPNNSKVKLHHQNPKMNHKIQDNNTLRKENN